MPQARLRSSLRSVSLVVFLLGCTGVATTEPQSTVAQAKSRPPASEAARDAVRVLERAMTAIGAARYEVAEPELTRLLETNEELRPPIEIALARLWLETGRRNRALAIAVGRCAPGSPLANDACAIGAEALRRRGDIEGAIAMLSPYTTDPGARGLRLLLADLFAEKGLTADARLVYRRLVEDYRDHRIGETDPEQLAITARAAHRLGAFREANELFNQAERTGVTDVKTLLFRGDLYLDAHDPKHAREVADEALRYAPRHPDALLLSARVRLAESRDAADAADKAQLALEVDSTLAEAYSVLAGLSLRDLDFAQTHRWIDAGLEREPRNLELSSLRAAAHFLSDETEAFQRDVAAVLGQNPDYARLFRLVAEYAEGEHRYADTIPLLRRALALDPMDSQVHAHLAIQLLRSGEEAEGRRELLRAFAQDPFDLRIRNTLVLYEQKLDREYTFVRRPPFTLRLPTAYAKPLSEIVTPWLEDAVADMNARYGKLDTDQLTLELYADQDSFGVRTSGVPSSDLQGVCFGQTIAARLPLDEPVNLGMTLWHELSHVYHLQLSKHRVPRWFTEGLAEVETKRHRSEWSREQELLVYEAHRAGKLPKITQMNRGFSHAANLDDLAVAYLTSTYLVDHLVRTYGWNAMPRLLRAWGNREPTEHVLTSVLGVSLDVLQSRFDKDLERRFASYKSQYLPPLTPIPPTKRNEVTAATSRAPKDLARVVHADILAGRLDAARAFLDALTPAERKHPDIIWVRGSFELLDGHPDRASNAIDELIATGHDGYFIRMQQALVAERIGDSQSETKALLRAREFHPTATEPLARLAAKARKEGDVIHELAYVSDLCKLEESDGPLHRRHVELRLKMRQLREAWLAAETLLFVDPLSRESHECVARAALAKGNTTRALRELELAFELSGFEHQPRPNTTMDCRDSRRLEALARRATRPRRVRLNPADRRRRERPVGSLPTVNRTQATLLPTDESGFG
ncbi:MAG: hypothetical protein QM784_34505 [Polyangiaceae bacterium]